MTPEDEVAFLAAAKAALPSALRSVSAIDGIFDDSELGFVDTIGKAAGGLIKGIGKAFKKKKKKPKNKVIQMEPTSIVGEVKKATAEAASPANAIQAIAAAIPGPVHEVVIEALKAQSLDKIAKERTMNQLSGQVDKTLKPKITALLTAVKSQALQKKATYEHNKLKSKAKFEGDVTDMLKQAYTKLSAIEARLGMSAVIPPSKVNIFGNRNILE